MVRLCKECKGSSLIDDRLRGDCICTSCGIVQSRLIDTEHEDKRTFSSDRSAAGRKSDNARTSVISNISGNVTSIKGDRNPNSKNAELIATLSGANKATITYKEQKMTDGRKGISQYCEDLKLVPKVKSRAEEIWGSFERNRKKYSRAGDTSMYLAIIHKACSDSGCARTFKEIAAATGGDHKQITRAYKRLIKNLKEQDTGNNKQQRKATPNSSAADTIPRIANTLNLPQPVITNAKKITKIASYYLEGKQPSTIAAASILFTIKHQIVAKGRPFTIPDSIKDKDVAAAASIAPATLRTAYKTLEENSNAIIDGLKDKA